MPEEPKPSGSGRRRWGFRVLALSLATIAGLLCAEGLLRLAGISHPLPYAPDPYCASTLTPGFRGYWSKEGGARIEVNRAGFRDREHALQKPPETLRVAVLGDSYIEAFQVPLEQMFASQLEQQLNRDSGQPGQAIKVLSFGVSGWGTASELLALRHHVWSFDPDVVLLAFFPGNDVRNNSRELEPMDCRPYFTQQEGKLLADFSFREHPLYVYAKTPAAQRKTRLINRSRILQVIQAFRQRDTKSADGQDARSVVEIGLDDGCFIPPGENAWQEAWRMTELLIEQLHLEVAARGKRFAVMIIPVAIQVHPDPSVRAEYQARLGIEDLEYAERRVQSLGDRSGFPVILLSGALRTYAEKNDAYLHGFANTRPGEGHWNADGHRLAARDCAAQLRPLLTSQDSAEDARPAPRGRP